MNIFNEVAIALKYQTNLNGVVSSFTKKTGRTAAQLYGTNPTPTKWQSITKAPTKSLNYISTEDRSTKVSWRENSKHTSNGNNLMTCASKLKVDRGIPGELILYLSGK